MEVVSPAREELNGQTSEEILRSIARSLNLLVKLALRQIEGDRKLSETILLLHSLGCRPVEIAELLGKTPNDVNPVLSRARTGTGTGRRPRQRRQGK